MTVQVIKNNFHKEKAEKLLKARLDNPIPLYGGQKKSSIKHIVFISKENRTYDEIFGQVKKSKGDASIARYGHGVSFTNRKKTKRVENATVMPNHLKLASNLLFPIIFMSIRMFRLMATGGLSILTQMNGWKHPFLQAMEGTGITAPL